MGGRKGTEEREGERRAVETKMVGLRQQKVADGLR
jgi:hypothetical protein